MDHLIVSILLKYRGKWLCCPVVFIVLSFSSTLTVAITGQNPLLFFWFSQTKYLKFRNNYYFHIVYEV